MESTPNDNLKEFTAMTTTEHKRLYFTRKGEVETVDVEVGPHSSQALIAIAMMQSKGFTYTHGLRLEGK